MAGNISSHNRLLIPRTVRTRLWIAGSLTPKPL